MPTAIAGAPIALYLKMATRREALIESRVCVQMESRVCVWVVGCVTLVPSGLTTMKTQKCLFLVCAVAIFMSPGAAGQTFRPEEIIAIERAALDRWGRGDPSGFLETYAPEVTYFGAVTEQRIDGLDAMKAWFAPIAGKIKIDRYEMLNPKVQRYGDVAVLSYNIVNYVKQPGGSEKAIQRWNSTAVYRLMDGRWRTIHSHFSYTKPDIKTDTAR
jgi:uncharacterized protein (TIGR02246 family)